MCYLMHIKCLFSHPLMGALGYSWGRSWETGEGEGLRCFTKSWKSKQDANLVRPGCFYPVLSILHSAKDFWNWKLQIGGVHQICFVWSLWFQIRQNKYKSQLGKCWGIRARRNRLPKVFRPQCNPSVRVVLQICANTGAANTNNTVGASNMYKHKRCSKYVQIQVQQIWTIHVGHQICTNSKNSTIQICASVAISKFLSIIVNIQ